MIKKLSKFKVVSSLFFASFILVLGGLVWAYATLRGVSGSLIMHFNNLVGINQVGGLAELAWIGATGVVVVLINSFVALELEARDWFLGKLLAAATLLFGILIFIGFAAIINVN